MSVDPTRPSDCAVCGRPIIHTDPYMWHQRLRVAIHHNCPLTDVCGEDVSTHTLLWFAGRR